jgi:hypothetical protein
MHSMASEHSDDKWISDYYGKLIAEQSFSRSRRDVVTNWGLTLFLAVIAVYGASVSSSVVVSHSWRISILLVGLGLVVRFFSQGTIAYAFLTKWRDLANAIELRWAYAKPSLDEIKKDIETYDHGKRASVTWRHMLWSQLRAGFLLIFSALSILVVVELAQVYQSAEWTWDVWALLIGILSYIAWEIYIFVGYGQLKRPPEKERSLPRKSP